MQKLNQTHRKKHLFTLKNHQHINQKKIKQRFQEFEHKMYEKKTYIKHQLSKTSSEFFTKTEGKF